MTSAERSYEYSKMFITYDTIEVMGREVVTSPQKSVEVKCGQTIYVKKNYYRFTVHPLPYGCFLRIESENPDGSLSVETEKRLLNAIFSNLEQLIEDAVSKHAFSKRETD